MFILLGIILLVPHIQSSQFDPKIIGGSTATDGQFPYQISIQYFNQHFCGGSIINSKHVLTAAHCMYRKENEPWKADEIIVWYGSVSLRNKGIKKEVLNIFVHEHYSSHTKENDIAVLRIEEITFTLITNNITLQTSSVPISSSCVISGWGVTQYTDNEASVNLLYTNVNITNKIECAKNYLNYEVYISENMLCAGLPQGGADACQGDSGGPLVCKGKQTGIVSFGIGCGEADYPGIYTDVSHYSDWISKQLTRSACSKITYQNSLLVFFAVYLLFKFM